MPAAIYGLKPQGSGQVPLALRPFVMYDPAAYWFGIPDTGERHGIGVIGRGRGDGGRDVLLPSCDWVEDSCVYNLGALYFRDTNCPNITIAANGTISASKLAVFNHDQSSSSFPDMPIGLYCASSGRSTYKIMARDYQTYDPLFHRAAGIAGIVNTATAEVLYNYSDLAHGSQFNFDVFFATSPSLLSLWAVRNMSVNDVWWRFSLDPFNDSALWRTYDFIQSPKGNGVNFYARTMNQNVAVPYTSIRSYGTLDIGGVTHTLVMVSVDWYYGGANRKNLEAPYYRLYPTADPSSVGGCSAYLLDEWVTVHKPTTT